MSLIDDVRKEREDLARVLKKHLGIRKIVEELYPDNAHFLYELLQNAEDTDATEVHFTLSADRLAYEHNGRPFEIKDIEGITDIGEGTKADDDEKIGRFGVGFKAVFAYSETPHIWSPTFSFKISELVLPTEIPEMKRLGKKTRFEFPFNNPKKSANAAYEEIKSGLDSLHEMTLLFLNNIGTISWKIGEGNEKKVSRLEHTECHVELIRSDKGSGDSKSCHYLRFKRPVAGLAKQYVAIAIQLEFLPTLTEKIFKKKDPLENQFRITSAIPGRVSVYFPAEKETSGLRFHLHAPFVPELSRASIKDTPANLPLYIQLAALTADSLPQIRDLGLLTGGFLAVLPNPQDTVPARYEHIRASIITAMNGKPLTPTHSGTHAPATQLLQSKSVLKELLSSIDISMLMGDGYKDWAISASQKNSNQDRFLSGLSIREYSIDYFAQRLLHQMQEWYDDESEQIREWYEEKAAPWHQKLYALLSQEVEDLLHDFQDVFFVRCRGNNYCRSSDCYLPVAGKDYGDELSLVDERVFTSGNSISQQGDSRNFLRSIGIREVSEAVYIEDVLRQRYGRWSSKPSDKDMERFVALVEAEPSAARLFANYQIFQIEDGRWLKSSEIFLDQPFIATGLSAWYANTAGRYALHKKYHKFVIKPARLAKFAEAVGAQVRLEISKTSCQHNPDRKLYYFAPGRRTEYEHDQDYSIDGIENVLIHPSHELSKLIWQALINSQNDWHIARYCTNQKEPYRTGPSTLAHHLINNRWVPQGDGIFVKPVDATVKKLPDDFQIAKGWAWLRAIGFGENDAALEQERQRQLEADKQKQELAKSLGFRDQKSLQNARKFAEHSPEEQERILAEFDKKKSTDLPEHAPKNATLRAERISEQANEAPERITEQRTRSVTIGKSAVTKLADEYLRHQYTNPDGAMICQVCQNELPFKLLDGSYYFETVELLPLTNRHLQNHLALCPNHAAMFKHANRSKDTLLPLVKDLDGHDLAIDLADTDERIYFTTTHLVDLKAVIDADASANGNGVEETDSSQEDFDDESEPTLSGDPEEKAPAQRIDEHACEPLSPTIDPNHPEMVQCPKCKARVRKDRLKRHMARAHNKQQSVPPLLFTIEQSPIIKSDWKPPSSPRYENCPHCHLLFLATQLKQHIARFHSGNQSRVTLTKRGR